MVRVVKRSQKLGFSLISFTKYVSNMSNTGIAYIYPSNSTKHQQYRHRISTSLEKYHKQTW